MDPLGFALDHFDAVGKWREADAGTPVDASGTLPDGSTFKGLDGLRTLLDSRREQFVATVTEKLLAYALGPGPGGLRHAGGAEDRARRGAGRPSLVVDRPRDRRQRAVQDADWRNRVIE